jgi:hypothetical protein
MEVTWREKREERRGGVASAITEGNDESNVDGDER